jgi:hypothetical protein
MSCALDIQARQFCSLRRQSQRLLGRACPALYIAVPPADAERRLLERAGIPYALCDGSAVIIGRPADELAPLLHVPRLPILPGGELPEEDPLSRQLAAALVDALLPATSTPGQICCLALPRTAGGPRRHQSPEWQFFSRLVRLRGYEPLLVERSQALVVAELGQRGFTGLGLLIDPSTSEMVLAHQGTVLVHAVVPRGGDWIDEQLARKTERIVWDMEGNGYVDVDAVARWKAQSAPSLVFPQNDEAQLLAYLYQQLLQDLVGVFAARCRECPEIATLRGPLPLVCWGGPTQADGFVPVMAERLERGGLPLAVGDTRVVADPTYTIARGCLILAELESPQVPLRRGA